jgi:tetratricopeptide (TPR) repeat protein
MPDQAVSRPDLLSDAAEAILLLSAFLAPAAIRRLWFADARSQAVCFEVLKESGNGAEVVPSVADWAGALDELAAKGHAAASEESITLCAPELDAARARIPKEQHRATVERTLRLVDGWTPENSDDPTTWKLMGELEPHLTRVLEFAEAEKIPHPTGVLMAQKLGVYLYLVGEITRAEPMIRRGLELDEAHFGPNHPNVAVDLNNLAFLLDGTGRGAETEPLKIRVVEILMQHQAGEPEKFATALANLASMLRSQGRFAEAEGLYRQAIQVEESRLGPQHRTLARELRNLGGLMARTNRLSEGEDLLRRALAIDEKTLGPNHPGVAADLQLLASILARQDKPEGLDKLHERALEIDAQWHPAHSPEVLQDLLGLADALERQQQADKAGEIYQRVVQNCEGKAPADLFPLILSLFKIAMVGVKRKDFAAAVALLRRALALGETWFGRDDPQVATLREALLSALSALGNFEEARAMALDERERQLRRKVAASPRDAGALNELGLFLKNERNDFAGAERCYRDAIALTPDDATIVANLAVLLSTILGNQNEAEQIYRRALELAPTDSSVLGNFASMIHNSRRRFEEAAQLYEMALSGDPKNAAVHTNYAALLIITGQVTEAIAYLDSAWKHQAGRHDRISARILFVKSVTEVLAGRKPDSYLGRLKNLFRRGMSHVAWATDALLDHLKARLKPEEAAFFIGVARAIDARATVSELDLQERWRVLQEVDLDAPWETLTEI